MAMSMVPGVGILTFPSKAEMRSTFLTSDSPAEVSCSCWRGLRVEVSLDRGAAGGACAKGVP